MAELEARPEDIQEVLGHKDPRTTRIYIHLAAQRLRAVVAKTRFDEDTTGQRTGRESKKER